MSRRPDPEQLPLDVQQSGRSPQKQVRSVLIIVQNLSVPRDPRVWREALTLRDAGYAVHVVCPIGPVDSARYERKDGIEIHRHPQPQAGSSALGYVREYAVALWWELRLAAKLSRSVKFDVVQICNPPDLLFVVAALMKLRQRVAVVFDHHDLSPELFAAKFGRKGAVYRLLRLAERLTFATADVVVSTNQSYREIAMTRGGKSEGEVFVVRNGPRLSEVDMDPVSSGHEDAADGRRVVGYVGMMAEQDGLDLLLEAARHMIGVVGRRDVHFLVVGDGPVWAGIRKRVDELGLAGRFEMPGFVTGTQLRRLIDSMDVCVAPDPKNSYSDRSTMIKVVEALAYGKPVVQFDLTEGRRSAGEASLYATPNDPVELAGKILEVLDSPSLSRRMVEDGRNRFVRSLCWDVQERQLLLAYDSACGEST